MSKKLNTLLVKLLAIIVTLIVVILEVYLVNTI